VRTAAVDNCNFARNWRWMLGAPVGMGAMGLIAGLRRLGSQPATLSPDVVETIIRAALSGFLMAWFVVFVARLVRIIRG
jgi:hypothetical protein